MNAAAWQTRLRENVARVRAEIAAACERSGRDPRHVHLVGVTKYVSVAVLRELVAAGVTDIGESRVQQLVARAEEVSAGCGDWPADAPATADLRPRWHLIGHLQRNKVKALLPHARIIHSLDSDRLAQALQQQAAALNVFVDVFIEVNVSGEETKDGLDPEAVPALVEQVRGLDRLRLRGLMTMAPYAPDPEHSRPYFARLRERLDRLRQRGIADEACHHLSMGMSQDYVVAVEEGATFLRVGSALFDELPTSDPRE